METFGFVLIIVGWFVLQKWVLPKFGIPTWMEPNACRGPAELDKKEDDVEEIRHHAETTQSSEKKVDQ